MGEVTKTIDHNNLAVIQIPENQVLLMIERAASDPNVDVDKMDRLMQIYQNVQTKQAESAFALAFRNVQAEMPKVGRNKENTQTRSFYADLEKVTTAVTPVYTRHGFSLSFGTENSPIERHVRIVCTLLHSGGHSAHYFYDAPIDDAGIAGAKNKTLTHGRASAISYAQRYLIKMIFNLIIANEDDDGNKAGGQKKIQSHQETPPPILKGFNREAYCKAVEEFGEDLKLLSESLDEKDFDTAIEIHAKLPEWVRFAVNVAPSKLPSDLAPVLTTLNRAAVRSDEWAAANRKYFAKQKETNQ